MQEEKTLGFVSHYQDIKPRDDKKFLIWASLAVHAIVVTLLIVVPLMQLTDVPEFESMAAFMVTAAPAPPPPPPPPPPAPKGGGQSGRPPRAVIRNADFMAPVVIPTEIPAEEFGDEDLGIPGGVEGGVPGGVIGGIVGGLPDTPPPAPPPKQEPVRLDHRASEAKPLVRVDPVYPELARQARAQGVVILEVLVGSGGVPQQMKVLRSVPMLEGAAKDAVEQWRWEPYVVNGEAVPFLVTVTVLFQLKT